MQTRRLLRSRSYDISFILSDRNRAKYRQHGMRASKRALLLRGRFRSNVTRLLRVLFPRQRLWFFLPWQTQQKQRAALEGKHALGVTLRAVAYETSFQAKCFRYNGARWDKRVQAKV